MRKTGGKAAKTGGKDANAGGFFALQTGNGENPI
jgi:hypothetical protein